MGEVIDITATPGFEDVFVCGICDSESWQLVSNSASLVVRCTQCKQEAVLAEGQFIFHEFDPDSA